jgi:DNA polymerase epsilon subunit 1
MSKIKFFEIKKATVPYNPYFYVGAKSETERDVLAYLSRKYFGKVTKMEIIEKEDLDLVSFKPIYSRNIRKLHF